MKLLSISLRLFSKRPWLNLILSIELTIAALAVMVVGNIYAYSQYNLSVLQNSKSRILYCSNYDFGLPNGTEQFRKKLQDTMEQFQEVKGFSTFISDVVVFNDEKVKDLKHMQPLEPGEAAYSLLTDDATIENISLPISHGEWLTTQLTPRGNVPCVIGGLYADQHSVGEVLPAYPIGVAKPGEEKVMIEIVGILSQPAHLPHAAVAASGKVAANKLFNDISNQTLQIILPEKYMTLSNPSQIHTSAWMYIDRSCTPERLDEIRDRLTREYTILDTDMIDQEKKQNRQTVQLMLPFITILFLVVFMGLLSLSVLTTLRNMQTFKIYYLVGSSKWRIMLTMLLYVLYFFLIAAFLFLLAFLWLGKNARLINPVAALDAYFLLNPTSLGFILAVCAVVLVCSLAVPFVLLKKNDLAQLLRQE